MVTFILFSRKTREVRLVITKNTSDEVSEYISSLGLEYHKNGRWRGYGKVGTKDTDLQVARKMEDGYGSPYLTVV